MRGEREFNRVCPLWPCFEYQIKYENEQLSFKYLEDKNKESDDDWPRADSLLRL